MTSGTTSLGRLQTLLPQLFTSSPVAGELFLRVQLTGNLTVGFSLDRVEEVQTIPINRITPIPNTHKEVLGLIQVKGYIFWLVDLAHVLGFPPLQNRRNQYEMVMMNIQSSSLNPSRMEASSDPKMFLGFAIQQVKGTFRVLPEDILPTAPEISSRLGSHVHGEIHNNGETIYLINI